MTYSRIQGTGSYLPERIVTNRELESMVDTTDEWIRERTGIERRHLAADGQTTCDLAEQAAQAALADAGISADDIDLIVVGTTTPDLVFPSTACLLQQRLGCPGIPAFDVNAACSSFIYAVSVADQFVKSGAMQHVLVVGAETLSRIVDWSDRSTCVLFGDGAGAVVLSASEQAGILSTHLHADGGKADVLRAPVGVSTGFEAKPNGGMRVIMKGNEVFKVAVRTLGGIVKETLETNGMSREEIDWLIPHQANMRIISATAKMLKMSLDQVVVTVHEHGNTSAASVPLALDKGIRDGRIRRGQLLLMEAFGGGFTWGSVLLRY